MFAIPITCLGAVAPWAIRLAVTDVREAGTVAGRLYALSTVGSILGTFLPVLVLIPAIGTRRTLLVCAALLALSAALLLPRRALLAPGRAGRAWSPCRWARSRPAATTRCSTRASRRTSSCRCSSSRDGDRILHLNEGWAVHSILPGRRPADGRLLGRLPVAAAADRAAGRATWRSSATRAARSSTSSARPGRETSIDGVEIDPVVSDVGRKYLGMDEPAPEGAHGRRALLAVRRRRRLRRVHHRRLPPAVHPVPPGHEGVLRAGRRPPEAGRRRRHQRRHPARPDRGGRPHRRHHARRLPGGAGLPLRRVQLDRRSPTPTRPTAADARGPPAPPPPACPPPPRTTSGAPSSTCPTGGEPLTDDNAPLERITDRALLEYLRRGAPGS